MPASSTSKKVLVSRFDRETLSGFVNPQSYLSSTGIELLTASGSAQVVPYSEVKLVCFVRDWGQGEPRRELRMFTTRPKMAGLWVRMTFRDGEAMDGILANNLLALESAGFSVIPPDPSFQNQRVFVPKEALTSLLVMGVVGTPLRQPRKAKPEKEEQQIGLFDG
ncbi:MAG TPA: hypothetical protein VKG25_13065 [Bryobacteraceae bacterium]|nr:hypothetical protein [Bryobacteraceae bacterium]